MLQLTRAREGDSVVPPAGAPVPSASGGPPGLGCVGDPCLLVRRCTVGPSLSRFACPGDAGEAEAAAALWNKSLRSCPRFGGVISGAGERPVKAGSDGAGGSATAELRPVLGDSDVGVHSSLLKPGMVLAVVMFYRGMAKGLVDARWMDWLLFFAACWRWVLFHGRRSSGCVPGRCASMVFFFCDSFQSLWAMGLFSIWVMLSLFLNPGVPDNGGGGRRRRRPRTAGTKASQNFVVIFFFCRDFCANWLGQLSSCILLEGACICSVLVYGFLV